MIIKARISLILLLSIFVMFGTNAQVRMCRVCKKSINTCPYKGRHPQPSARAGANTATSAKHSPAPKVDTSPMENRTYTVNGVSFTMIGVQGGSFQMGAPADVEWSDHPNRPVHKVTLSSYRIGETEVTQGLWEAVMGANPSKTRGSHNPVEMVSWEDCQVFIKKLNAMTGKRFRLPTEAEWEYAARGGQKTHGYLFSGSNDCVAVAWFWGGNMHGDKSYPVATKQPNELGIYDMSGNVNEYCQDWLGDYTAKAQVNPKGPAKGPFHVDRGGSFGATYGSHQVFRRPRPTDKGEARNMYTGFRLAMYD